MRFALPNPQGSVFHPLVRNSVKGVVERKTLNASIADFSKLARFTSRFGNMQWVLAAQKSYSDFFVEGGFELLPETRTWVEGVMRRIGDFETNIGLLVRYYRVPKRIYKFSRGKVRYKPNLTLVSPSSSFGVLWRMSGLFILTSGETDDTNESEEVGLWRSSKSDKLVWFISELLGLKLLRDPLSYKNIQWKMLEVYVQGGYRLPTLKVESRKELKERRKLLDEAA